MRRLLCVVALCTIGLTACGTDYTEANEANEAFETSRQGLACVTGTGECPGDTVCAYFQDDPYAEYEGLCRPPCINGTCQNSNQICCTHPTGPSYCNWACL